MGGGKDLQAGVLEENPAAVLFLDAGKMNPYFLSPSHLLIFADKISGMIGLVR